MTKRAYKTSISMAEEISIILDAMDIAESYWDLYAMEKGWWMPLFDYYRVEVVE